MVRYRKKETKLKPIKKISFALCIAAILFAVLSYGSSTNYQLETATEIKVSSGVDILLRGEGMYNDTIYLTKDITVTDKAQIGSVDYPFRGVFDGNGHTVTLDYAEADVDTSLFNYIAPEAIVRNVTFVYKNVTVDGNSFGGVARINDGTIENCKVVFDNITLTSDGLFSPFVLVNRGSISNVVVRGMVSKASSRFNEDKALYGSVCVYNSGTMASLVADVEFNGFECTDREKYDNGEVDNVSLSAVRYDDLENGSMKDAWAVVPATQISSDDGDEVVRMSTREEVYDYNIFFDKIFFETDTWECGDNDVIIKRKTK